jgi:hypothetical protein
MATHAKRRQLLDPIGHGHELPGNLVQLQSRHPWRVLDQKIKTTAREAKAQMNSNLTGVSYLVTPQPRIVVLRKSVHGQIAHKG